MKLTKSAPSAPFSSSKDSFPAHFTWVVAVALIAGVAIGAVGTWLLAEQVDQLNTNITNSYFRK